METLVMILVKLVAFVVFGLSAFGLALPDSNALDIAVSFVMAVISIIVIVG